MKRSLFFLVLTALMLTIACATGSGNSGKTTAYEGYTLFNPQGSATTYLINTGGEIIHSWESEYRTGNSVYLLENGNLLRTANLKAEFGAAGGAGRIEELSWEGEVLWAFEYSDDNVHFHHDIEPLDNGNVLVVAWERVSAEELIAAGRDPRRRTGESSVPLG